MELFRLLGKIAIDNSGANDAIDDTTGRAEKSHSKIAGAFGKIGQAAIALGKTVVVGLGAAITAIGLLSGSALSSYADFEQLVGGVETLFKDSAGIVTGYAEQAFKTAGLSANEYMETVTSFSASLIQSLEGDTAAAAEKANQAIVDMSDNANKMGSSMESIQNAYQGFAKQNYTMLDNLKLGYGGTKEEMQRLLEDAQAISGIEYDISSYADVVDAIHVIQDEMGIAGTTAKEASETISGSLLATKAAWKNLVTGMANEDADMSALINNFVSSAETAINNVLPRMEVIFAGIGDVITRIVPIIAEKLPELLNSLLPGLIQGAVALFNGLVAALPAIVQILVEQMPFIVSEIGKGLKAAFPQLIAVAQELFGQLWESISGALGGNDITSALGLDGIIQFFTTMWETCSPTISRIIEVCKELGIVIKETFDTVIVPVFDMFMGLVNDLFLSNQDNMNAIAEVYNNVLGNIRDELARAKVWIESFILPFLQMVVEYAKTKMDDLKAFLQGAFDTILGIVKFFVAVFTGDWQGMGEALKQIAQGIWKMLVSCFNSVKEDLSAIMQTIKSKLSSIWESIKTTITTKISSIVTTVKTKFESIKAKIVDTITAAKDKVKEAIDQIKSFFNFEWSLPPLKLPHIKIKGEWDLKEGKFPEFGVEWYKKGAVLTEPTIFGMHGNNAMVGGEAGAEAVAPIDVLQGYVAEAVASQNAELLAVLQAILAAIVKMDAGLANKLLNAIENGLTWEVNGREFGRMVRKYA